MNDKYFWSAKECGFYPESIKELYENSADGWPEDAIEISERWYLYLLKGQEAGMVIISNQYGLPELSDPPNTPEEEGIAWSEDAREELMKNANSRVTELQDINDLGIASEEEAKLLSRWKHYRVKLNRLDLSAGHSIEWPAKPE